MSHAIPSEHELAMAIEQAVRSAVKDLFSQHQGEHFYYLTLVTTGGAHAPVLSAWSQEALEEAVKDSVDKADARWGLKWSYADSPFFCTGDSYFLSVRDLFQRRPNIHLLDHNTRKSEYNMRLRAMEDAISKLDQEGLFGHGAQRAANVVNVEVMPPDHSNTERAKRLNPPDAIRDWLLEIAE